MHIANLRTKFGKFSFAPREIVYNPEKEDEQLELLIPGIQSYLKKRNNRIGTVLPQTNMNPRVLITKLTSLDRYQRIRTNSFDKSFSLPENFMNCRVVLKRIKPDTSRNEKSVNNNCKNNDDETLLTNSSSVPDFTEEIQNDCFSSLNTFSCLQNFNSINLTPNISLAIEKGINYGSKSSIHIDSCLNFNNPPFTTIHVDTNNWRINKAAAEMRKGTIKVKDISKLLKPQALSVQQPVQGSATLMSKFAKKTTNKRAKPTNAAPKRKRQPKKQQQSNTNNSTDNVRNQSTQQQYRFNQPTYQPYNNYTNSTAYSSNYSSTSVCSMSDGICNSFNNIPPQHSLNSIVQPVVGGSAINNNPYPLNSNSRIYPNNDCVQYTINSTCLFPSYSTPTGNCTTSTWRNEQCPIPTTVQPSPVGPPPPYYCDYSSQFDPMSDSSPNLNTYNGQTSCNSSMQFTPPELSIQQLSYNDNTQTCVGQTYPYVSNLPLSNFNCNAYNTEVTNHENVEYRNREETDLTNQYHTSQPELTQSNSTTQRSNYPSMYQPRTGASQHFTDESNVNSINISQPEQTPSTVHYQRSNKYPPSYKRRREVDENVADSLISNGESHVTREYNRDVFNVLSSVLRNSEYTTPQRAEHSQVKQPAYSTRTDVEHTLNGTGTQSNLSTMNSANLATFGVSSNVHANTPRTIDNIPFQISSVVTMPILNDSYFNGSAAFIRKSTESNLHVETTSRHANVCSFPPPLSNSNLSTANDSNIPLSFNIEDYTNSTAQSAVNKINTSYLPMMEPNLDCASGLLSSELSETSGYASSLLPPVEISQISRDAMPDGEELVEGDFLIWTEEQIGTNILDPSAVAGKTDYSALCDSNVEVTESNILSNPTDPYLLEIDITFYQTEDANNFNDMFGISMKDDKQCISNKSNEPRSNTSDAIPSQIAANVLDDHSDDSSSLLMPMEGNQFREESIAGGDEDFDDESISGIIDDITIEVNPVTTPSPTVPSCAESREDIAKSSTFMATETTSKLGSRESTSLPREHSIDSLVNQENPKPIAEDNYFHLRKLLSK